MRSKNKLKLQLIGAAFFFIFVGGILWWQLSTHDGLSPQIAQHQLLPAEEKLQVQLYFADVTADGLVPESRLLAKHPILEKQAKLIVQELILGPKHGQFQPTIPPKSQLREFYLDEQGCAYLDFDSNIKTNHSGGVYAELLTIASLVKTLTANFEQVKQVKLLINGAEVETLAGHIDTRFPFSLDNLSLARIIREL